MLICLYAEVVNVCVCALICICTCTGVHIKYNLVATCIKSVFIWSPRSHFYACGNAGICVHNASMRVRLHAFSLSFYAFMYARMCVCACLRLGTHARAHMYWLRVNTPAKYVRPHPEWQYRRSAPSHPPPLEKRKKNPLRRGSSRMNYYLAKITAVERRTHSRGGRMFSLTVTFTITLHLIWYYRCLSP